MKHLFIFILISGAIVLFAAGAFAQNKIIVLARHAEKLPPVDTDLGDPALSPEGRERAARLTKAIEKYRFNEIFVTAYKRTGQTAELLAAMRHVQPETYESDHQPELVKKIMASKNKRFLIVGHSNSIPDLANLLMKKEVFKQLADTEYGVYWVVRIKNGEPKKIEVYPY